MQLFIQVEVRREAVTNMLEIMVQRSNKRSLTERRNLAAAKVVTVVAVAAMEINQPKLGIATDMLLGMT